MTLLSKARYALACVRIVSGMLALVAPSLIIRRFGENPDDAAAAVYGLRLFGVRTVLIGADLVTERGQALERTINQAILIHASDTLTAAKLGTSGRLRPALAVPVTAISALNTVFAIAAWIDCQRNAPSERRQG